MPEGILVFGNLEDIIFVRGMEIDIIQAKINAIEEEFADEEFCKLYCKQDNCNGCPSNQDCDVARKILQEEIKKINHELIFLWHELDFYEQRIFNERLIK